MHFSAVALVLCECVVRVQAIEPHHDSVTSGFGQDGGGADRGDVGVTANNSDTMNLSIVEAQVGQAIPVNLYRDRHHRQPEYRTPHRKHCGGQDVQGVNFGAIGPGD